MPICTAPPSSIRRSTGAALAVALSLGLAACAGPPNRADGPQPLSRERIAEIVASPDRSDADRTND